MTSRRILLALALAACGDDPESVHANPERLTDQSGAVFGWQCTAENCDLANVSGTPSLPECGPGTDSYYQSSYSFAWGMYVQVTAVCREAYGWSAEPNWGRFLVCEADEDCPVIYTGGDPDVYVCDAGYCKNAALADAFDELPARWEMTAMCFGDRPRYEPFEDPELTAAIAAACPGDASDAACTSIPAGCPDPRG